MRGVGGGGARPVVGAWPMRNLSEKGEKGRVTSAEVLDGARPTVEAESVGNGGKRESDMSERCEGGRWIPQEVEHGARPMLGARPMEQNGRQDRGRRGRRRERSPRKRR